MGGRSAGEVENGPNGDVWRRDLPDDKTHDDGC
jgi:hypothetical protein